MDRAPPPECKQADYHAPLRRSHGQEGPGAGQQGGFAAPGRAARSEGAEDQAPGRLQEPVPRPTAGRGQQLERIETLCQSEDNTRTIASIRPSPRATTARTA